jgi:hypothetical protein
VNQRFVVGYVPSQVEQAVFFPGRDVAAGETRAQEVGELLLKRGEGEVVIRKIPVSMGCLPNKLK